MSILQSISSIGQGQEADRLAKRNALIDEADAKIAIEDARSEASIELRRSSRIRAEQSARFAGSGIAPGTGTPLQLAAQEVVNAELRASSELRAGAMEASRRKQSAALHRQRGKAAKRAGFIGALTPFAGDLRALGSKASKGALSLQSNRALRSIE